MILVADPSKPFQYTPKGTPRRQIILDAYEEEVGRGYDAIEELWQPDIPLPQIFTLDTTLNFTLTTIEKIMGRLLTSDEDIFQNGCDRYDPSTPQMAHIYKY